MAGDMPSANAQESTLKELEASLNKIFMNVGSVFNNAVPSESDKLAKTKSRLHNSIPGAVDRLNDALDILEGDLMRTRAVLSRDVRLLLVAEEKKAGAEQRNTAHDVPANIDVSGQTRASVDLSTMDDISSSPEMVMRDAPQVMKAEEAQSRVEAFHDPKGASNSAATGVPNVQTQKANDLPRQPHGQLQADSTPGGQTLISRAVKRDTEMKHEHVPSTNQAAAAQPSTSTHQDQTTQERAADDVTKDEQAEPSPGNDFSSLLPGLDMYANDPSGDAMGGMDHFNDMNNADAFDVGNSTEVNGDPFGTAEDMNPEMNQFSGDFNIDDMISFDANGAGTENNGQGTSGGQDALAEFDDDFFNMG